MHSGSYEPALEIGGRLEAGAVHINDVALYEDAHEVTRWQWITARDTPDPMPLGAA